MNTGSITIHGTTIAEGKVWIIDIPTLGEGMGMSWENEIPTLGEGMSMSWENEIWFMVRKP